MDGRGIDWLVSGSCACVYVCVAGSLVLVVLVPRCASDHHGVATRQYGLLVWSRFSSWDTLFLRLSGKEDAVRLMGMCNPLGLVHYLCADVMLRVVGVGEKSRQRLSAAVVLATTVVLSVWFESGGLGGTRTALLLVGLGAVHQTVGVDRGLWMVWWTILLVFEHGTVQRALSSGRCLENGIVVPWSGAMADVKPH